MTLHLSPHGAPPRVPEPPGARGAPGRAAAEAVSGLRGGPGVEGGAARPGARAAADEGAAPADERGGSPGGLGAFEEVYEAHFDFVWRTVRRLGVPAASVEDAVQDVFVVVHRRAAEFEGRSSVKTWLFGIVVHVARAYRRRRVLDALDDPDAVVDPRARSPHAHAEAAEAMRVLHQVLDALDDERREVFVLMELSEMTAPETAEALGLKLNTVYSRLRAARHDFDAEVERRAARDGWRFA